MDNELKVINQQEVLGKEFKVYGTLENPLFLAKDVAEWIDYSYKDSRKINRDVSKMLSTIDDEEKTKAKLKLGGEDYSHGGVRENTEMWFITEDGLYEVLMQSRKPIAKEFKKEVKKILKQMRLTGGSVVKGREEEFISNYFPSFSEEVKLAMVQDLRKQNEQYKTKIKELEPKAEFYDDVAGSKDSIEMGHVAKVLNIKGYGRNNLFQYLREQKVLDRNNIPYQSYVDRGYFRVLEQKYTTSKGEVKINIKTLVFQKGVDYIRKLIKDNENGETNEK